jgi:DNA replication initiation complex subunit (GINS family)
VLRIKEQEYSKEDIKKIITNDIDKFEKAVIADVNNDECLNLTAEDKEYVYKKFKEIINDRQNSKC